MAEAETLTAQGDVPGTLAYISPERLAGEHPVAAARPVWTPSVPLAEDPNHAGFTLGAAMSCWT